MARRVEAFDWASTPLGPRDQWPVELRSLVSMVLESHFPTALVWGPAYTTIYNDAFRPILGDKPEALGRSFAEIWAEAWDEIGPIARRAYGGEATFIEDFPLVVDRRGGPEQAFFTFCYSPVRLADGSVAGMIDTVIETTATVRARADLEVLNHELRHRLKNSLASMQMLVRQTLKEVPERTPVDALLERIVALGAAHDVLFHEGWTSATVEYVARAALAGLLDLGRIELSGPVAPMGARAAVALSLVLHELATNAAKYGALSSPGGRVGRSWSIDADRDRLRLTWDEAGGPPVRAPARTGFGTRLIEMGLTPNGEVRRDYRPEGLRITFDADLAELAVG